MKNKGFSIIETILVIAVVALLGFVGWRVWEAKKDKGNNGQNTQQQNQQANEQKSEELNPDGYLHIRELGVKMKLPQEIKDAEYYYNPRLNSTSDYLTVQVYDSSLFDEYGNCDPMKKDGPFGALTRTTKNTYQGRDDLPLKSDERNVFSLSDNSFVYTTSPQAPCAEDVDTLMQKMKAYSEALKTIELDQ